MRPAVVIGERCARGDAAELRGVGFEAESAEQVAHDHRDLGALGAAVEVELVHDQGEDVVGIGGEPAARARRRAAPRCRA